jgi:hypothetical protein
MLYNLVQIRRGKRTVMMTDALTKVNDRLRTLRQGHRKGIKNQPVSYVVEKAATTEKFRKKPHNYPEHGI